MKRVKLCRYLVLVILLFTSCRASDEGVAVVSDKVGKFLGWSISPVVGSIEFNAKVQAELDQLKTINELTKWLYVRSDAVRYSVRLSYVSGELIVLWLHEHGGRLYVSKIIVNTTRKSSLRIARSSIFSTEYQLPLDQLEIDVSK